MFSRAIPDGDTKITAVTHSQHCILLISFTFPYSDLLGGTIIFSQDGGGGRVPPVSPRISAYGPEVRPVEKHCPWSKHSILIQLLRFCLVVRTTKYSSCYSQALKYFEVD